MALQQTVEEYLRSKNLEVYRAGSGQLTLQCLWHDDASHRKGKLYVNAENGCLDCKVCGVQGGFRMLLEFFGDEPDESQEAFRPSRRLAINTQYADLAALYLSKNAEMMKYLEERGISAEVAVEAKLGWHPRSVGLIESIPGFGVAGGFKREELVETSLINARGTEFHAGKITIPYLTGGQAIQVRGKDPRGKYQTPAGDKVRIYNSDALNGADVAFLVEGEFDCLIVRTMLALAPEARARNIAVVAVPGTQALPGGKEEFAAHFESCSRVYVAFDADEAGRRGALAVKELLGKKARNIELPEEGLDWTDWLGPKGQQRPHGGHGWADIMRLITICDMENKRVFSVREAAAELREMMNSKPAVQTGFRSLDALIRPGLYPGSLTIPLARTGVGKSLVLQNMVYNLRETPFLLITLEITKGEVWKRFERIARFYNPLITEEEIYETYRNLGIADENRLNGNDIDRLIEEFAEEHGGQPSVVAVDYLGYYAKSAPGSSQYEKMSNAVMGLKAKAKEHKVAMISPGQVGRGNRPGEPISEMDARDAGSIEETADFLLGFWRPWESEGVGGANGQVEAKLKMNILKSRAGNKGRVVDLAMSHHSLTILDPVGQAKLAIRIDQENEAYNRGEAYETVYQRARESALKKMNIQSKLELDAEPPPWLAASKG